MHFDCVIIPGFGGFISNPGSARISGTKQLISPPERTLAFNINLNQNDGLLYSFVAGKESTSYAGAIQKVQQAVRDIQAHILQHQHYFLTGIGEFRQRPNGSIEFKPDQLEHYSLDSYGLNMMQLIPVRRDARILKMKTTKKAGNVYSKTSQWVSGISAAAIVILLGFSILTDREMQMNESVTSYSNETSLIPFISADKYSKQLPYPAIPGVKETPAENMDTVFIGSIHSHSIPQGSTSASFEDKIITEEKHYLLVAGVFRNENNARNYILELKNKGVNASLEKSAGTKTFKVIIGNYSNKEEAVQGLSEARRIIKDSWILTL